MIKGKANLDTLPDHSQTHMQWLMVNFPDYHRTGLTKFEKGKQFLDSQKAKNADKRRKKWEARGFFWDPDKADRYTVCTKANCDNRVYPSVVGSRIKVCGPCRVNSKCETKSNKFELVSQKRASEKAAEKNAVQLAKVNKKIYKSEFLF